MNKFSYTAVFLALIFFAGFQLDAQSSSSSSSYSSSSESSTSSSESSSTTTSSSSSTSSTSSYGNSIVLCECGCEKNGIHKYTQFYTSRNVCMEDSTQTERVETEEGTIEVEVQGPTPDCVFGYQRNPTTGYPEVILGTFTGCTIVEVDTTQEF